MTERTKRLWLLPVGVAASTLASLAGVWLLSEAVGFRFMPGLVAALSGATGAVLGIRLCQSGEGNSHGAA